jgi:hypothetical protein
MRQTNIQQYYKNETDKRQGHSMSDWTVVSTMSSLIFIFILQVYIHEVKVFSKFQFLIVTELLNIN